MNIDINCDLGESFGNFKIGMDEAIMPYISSVNIACGFHAGDPMVMEKTIQLALKHNVGIGAHPGYPDLQGFGRRNLKMSYQELYTSILYQVSALKGMTEALGGKLNHVKPHGALYNQAAKFEEVANAIIDAVKAVDDKLIIFGLANSLFINSAKNKGLKTANEVFADRAYMDDGSLVSRNKEGAIIHDMEIAKNRSLEMVNGSVKSINGNQISMKADTICIHGDNPSAVELAKRIHHYLSAKGVEINKISR
jgi:UPF0271 protein